MRKYYMFMSFLTLFVIGSVLLGFNEGGSPRAQKLKALDTQRVSDMNSLRYSIENYYQTNKKLPQNLDQLSPKPNKTDPETKNPYEYKTSSDISYQLCTNFATDTTTANNNDLIYNGNQTHKKGYDCITYTLPNYIYQAPTPYVRSDWREFKSSILAEFDSYAASTDEPRIVIKENTIVKIVYLENTEILDKSGQKANVETFQSKDKILVDTTMMKQSNSYKASRIQNLSR